MKKQGFQAKLKNRRVFLGRMEGNNSEFLLGFKILVESEVRKERIQVTKLRLTNEAMHCLVGMYMERYMDTP